MPLSAWQQLLLAVCDPRKQPHAFIDAPLGLADAIAAALREEGLCLCQRCPADNWTADPDEPAGCRMCAEGSHA